VPANGLELKAAHTAPVTGEGEGTLDGDHRRVIGVDVGLEPDRQGLRRANLDLVGKRGAIVLRDVTKNDLEHQRLIRRRKVARLHR
jgi:hypothetical protein